MHGSHFISPVPGCAVKSLRDTGFGKRWERAGFVGSNGTAGRESTVALTLLFHVYTKSHGTAAPNASAADCVLFGRKGTPQVILTCPENLFDRKIRMVRGYSLRRFKKI